MISSCINIDIREQPFDFYGGRGDIQQKCLFPAFTEKNVSFHVRTVNKFAFRITSHPLLPPPPPEINGQFHTNFHNGAFMGEGITFFNNLLYKFLANH